MDLVTVTPLGLDARQHSIREGEASCQPLYVSYKLPALHTCDACLLLSQPQVLAQIGDDFIPYDDAIVTHVSSLAGGSAPQ